MGKGLEIFLLGGLIIHLDGQPIANLTSTKARAMFVYLAYHQRPFPRDTLATLFYGDLPQKRAAANLRVLLSRLRPLNDYLAISRHTVAIDPECDYWLDATALEQQLTAAGMPTPANAAQIAAALSLYRGDFLAGFHVGQALDFEEWRIIEQERLRQRVIEASSRLIDCYLAHNQLQPGLDQANQLLRLDPLREETHRQLMVLLARNGQRSAALTQYRRCRQLLADELGVEPAPETTELHERILALEETDQTQVDLPLVVAEREANLPRQLTPFIGRNKELVHLKAQLSQPDCRLLSLVGLGGVGKTRLALQLTHQLAAAETYPDGLYFVPLAAVSGRQFMAAAIAETLRFSFQGHKQPEAELIDYLRQKKLLLVLDNVEHLPTGAELVVDILQAAPNVKILVISRQRLNVSGEWVVPVTGLAYPAKSNAGPDTLVARYSAVRLFVQSAARVQPGFSLTAGNAPAVVRICRLVGGMPLALAAAWLRALSCREIAAEIEQNLNFLTTSLQDVPERHQSLAAVFNYSWQLLSPTEQQIFCRLSVFRGQFNRAAAEHVAGANLFTLASLVDKSWLNRDAASDSAASARYALHNLLQRYATEKLAETPQAQRETHQKHARYYTTFLHQQTGRLRGSGQGQALQAISHQIENVRTAWNWAIDHQQLAEIDQALESLFHFYDMRSWFNEGKEAFGRASQTLSKAASAQAQVVLGRLLARQAWFIFHLGQHTQARDQLQQSLQLLRQANASTETVFCLNYLAAIFRHLGEYGQAKDALEESLAICQTTEERFGASIALNILGQVASLQGDYATARDLCRQALALKRELGDQWGMTYSLTYLGRVAEAQRDYPEAQQLFQESLSIYEEMEDKRGIAFAYQNLGHLAQAQADHAAVIRRYQAALELFEEIGNQLGVVTCLLNLAEVTGRHRNFQAAKSYLHRALRLTATFQTWPKTLDILIQLASLLAQFGQQTDALALLTTVQHHLVNNDAASRQLAPVANKLKAALPAQTVAAIQSQHEPKPLNEIIDAILNRSDP